MTTIKEYAELYNQLSNSNEYTQIPLIPEEWKVIKDSAEINTYLPQENNINITTGITTHKKHHIKNFESIDLCETIKNKKGHIINTGGSIWGIDFVPKKAALPDKTHYLAVGGYNSTNERHHYKKEDEMNVRNAIQIWQYTDETAPKLSMCILHEFGIVIDFKWCPFSVYDEQDKLGILAALFGDGDIRLFVVPHPQLVHHQENIDEQETIYLRVENPRVSLSLPRTYNLCFAWGGNGKLASGAKSGNIVVWDILNSLLQKIPVVHVTIPNASLSAVKSLSWLSLLLDHDLFVSADADGCIRLHDLSDPFISSKIFRVRCTYICVLGTGHGKEFLFSDIDGVTRKNSSFTSKFSFTLTMHNSIVWSIAASPYHGVIASVGSDGSVMVKTFSHDAFNIPPRHKLDMPEFTLYKLTYDTETKEFQYIDGLKPTTSLPERIYQNIFIDPVVSIHKVAWNNNKNACGWVASGGEAGLVRLDYTGLG